MAKKTNGVPVIASNDTNVNRAVFMFAATAGYLPWGVRSETMRTVLGAMTPAECREMDDLFCETHETRLTDLMNLGAESTNHPGHGLLRSQWAVVQNVRDGSSETRKIIATTIAKKQATGKVTTDANKVSLAPLVITPRQTDPSKV